MNMWWQWWWWWCLLGNFCGLQAEYLRDRCVRQCTRDLSLLLTLNPFLYSLNAIYCCHVVGQSLPYFLCFLFQSSAQSYNLFLEFDLTCPVSAIWNILNKFELAAAVRVWNNQNSVGLKWQKYINLYGSHHCDTAVCSYVFAFCLNENKCLQSIFIFDFCVEACAHDCIVMLCACYRVQLCQYHCIAAISWNLTSMSCYYLEFVVFQCSVWNKKLRFC